MAYQGHIVVPTTHERSEDVIRHITTKMAVRFGGYSTYDGRGGWDNGEEIVEETHTRIVVNIEESEQFDRENLERYLEIEAQYVKDELDEDAVMIEIHELDMELV